MTNGEKLKSLNFLVMGASGGIGSALSHQLIAQGHNVLLAGRNEPALKTLSHKKELLFPTH